MTTHSQDLLCLIVDGSTEWITLRKLKESHPFEVAEYATTQGIDEEPTICWWIPCTLRKRDRLISAVKSRIDKLSHKYGVELPKSVKHAYDIDRDNGNSLQCDTIKKEMGNLKVAFDILDKESKLPSGYIKASGHMVFDVRMTLERKSRWLKDVHRTPEPSHSTFIGIVSRESICIALTYASLNGLSIFGADI